MAITTDDFNKIWASTSPLTPYSFSASQYKEGWNFIGSTPPSRQMWDFLQKNNDEKMQYLLNHFDNYLPLAGGTMTGDIIFGNNEAYIQKQNTDIVNRNQLEIGWGRPETTGGGEWFLDGAKMAFHKYDANNSSHDNGGFVISTTDETNHPQFAGYPDGRLTWGDKDVERVNASGSNYIRYESGIQIVFDRIGVSGASSYVKTYTYPVAFKSNSNVCITTGIRWASSNEQVSIQNDSNTKFEINITNASSNSHHMFFIAIGEWK